MSKTAIIFSPRYYQHNPGRGHPESPKRLSIIINELKRRELSENKNWQFVAPEKACIKDVELVHDSGYVRFVRTFCSSGGGLLDLEDTVASTKTFEVALYAVGGALKAVNLVMEGKFRNAFALVRPPGHHAEKYRAFGFCVFNNVAIATKYLLEKYGLKRVLILDIDAHHGNGIQQTFYETSKVLYISLHQDPRNFPGTGFIDEVGECDGLGYNVNIPLPFSTNDHIYLKAVKQVATPIIYQYKPQFILISAGLDGHYGDPVGSLSLSTRCYQEVYARLVDCASKICDGKLVSVLEGGYSLKFIGKTALATISKMSGNVYVTDDRPPLTSKRCRRLGEKVIGNVKKVQNAFWSLD